MNYWLFKSEPTSYSIDDLVRDTTMRWDGIRNYQARNMLRDDVKKGDKIIFYHSSCAEPAAVGTAKVARAGYPDFTAWDPSSENPDAKSTPEKPMWFMVDITFSSKFKTQIRLKDMHENPRLADMRLLQKGNRLSIFPILKKHFETLVHLGAQ